MRICFLAPRIPPTRCGIGDYCARLMTWLDGAGFEVLVITGMDQAVSLSGTNIEVARLFQEGGAHERKKVLEKIHSWNPDLISLEFEPTLYNRFGLNFSLLSLVRKLKKDKFSVLCRVHEMYVPWFSRWQWAFLAAPQRLLLWALVHLCDSTAVSIERWTQTLKNRVPWKRKSIHWVGVGSNMPVITVSEEKKAERRQALGIPQDKKVVATFCPVGSGRDPEFLTRVWQEVEKTRKNLHLLVLGVGREHAAELFPNLVTNANCHFPGFLEGADISEHLQISDIFFAPFTDGLSTRRTSAMAGLQHGLPTVTTRGHLFDKGLFEKSPVTVVNWNEEECAKAIFSASKVSDEVSTQTKALFETELATSQLAQKLFFHPSLSEETLKKVGALLTPRRDRRSA